MNLQIPVSGGVAARPVGEFETRTRDEVPAVILRDIVGRRRPGGHVIVFANEKGGVGKSTLAYQCALALSHRGFRVTAVDCDRRQGTLHNFLQAREGSARTLRLKIPQPRFVLLEAQSGALLLQELERVGRESDFVVIDLAGHDGPTARRAIAIADTVVTPVNCSAADLDSLGSIHPITRRLRRTGAFAQLVIGLRDERERLGLGAFDWVVVKNRVRHCERRLIASADRQLSTMARHMPFRVADGLTERLAYRELLPFGLSHLDFRFLPQLLRRQSAPSQEVEQFVAGLRLPDKPPREKAAWAPTARAPVLAQAVESYRRALGATAAVPVAAE